MRGEKSEKKREKERERANKEGFSGLRCSCLCERAMSERQRQRKTYETGWQQRQNRRIRDFV